LLYLNYIWYLDILIRPELTT